MNESYSSIVFNVIMTSYKLFTIFCEDVDVLELNSENIEGCVVIR